jgi:hypoxanthine phosphoribosyltransferase
MDNKVFLGEEEVLLDAYRLGVQIFNAGFHPSYIVGLWRGGSTVGIAVQECLQALGVETNHISIRTSYSGVNRYQEMIDNPEDTIKVHGTQYLLESLNRTDSLLIVDDVYSTGLNVDAVIRRLQSRLKRNMPRSISVACLWYKPEKNRTDRTPDYYIHQGEDWLVLPYELCGLTDEELRDQKPFVLPILKPDSDL